MWKIAIPLSLAAAMTVSASGAAWAGDAAAGEKVYKKCKACHALEAGKNKVGPSLAGIAGSDAGKVEGYKYSKALLESGVVWDDASLDAYLAKPKDFIKGTKMSFAGLKKEEDRANVIEFLKQH